MSKYKHHIVYRTINKVNGKEYIGLHSTNRIEDGYLGSGWVLKDAIKKYGRECFHREVLHVFSSRSQARTLEAALVTPDYCKRPDTYNLVPGGMGVENQFGEANPMYGKPAHNAKPVVAYHRDGREVRAGSLEELGNLIGIARQNVRKLLQSGKRGRRGWVVQSA